MDKSKNNRTPNHLANERTFLAWIRTSIALMGFGFVIVKFSLYLKQMAFFVPETVQLPQNGKSQLIGILMVALGVILAILSFFEYKRTSIQLENDIYSPSAKLPGMLVIAMVIGGIVLISYLYAYS